MPIDITLDQFNSMPRKKKDEVMFDNLQAIRKSVHSPDNCILREDLKQIRILGTAWLIVLTVALGFKNYLPF